MSTSSIHERARFSLGLMLDAVTEEIATLKHRKK